MKIKLNNSKKEISVKDIKIGQFFKLTTNDCIYLRIGYLEDTSNDSFSVVYFGSLNSKNIYPKFTRLCGSLCVEEIYNHIEFTE